MARTEEHQHSIKVEEGWPVIQEGVDKLIKGIEGDNSQSFSSEDYMRYYTYPCFEGSVFFNQIDSSIRLEVSVFVICYLSSVSSCLTHY